MAPTSIASRLRPVAPTRTASAALLSVEVDEADEDDAVPVREELAVPEAAVPVAVAEPESPEPEAAVSAGVPVWVK